MFKRERKIGRGDKGIRIPELLWYGNTETTLHFPSSWSVSFCPMQGEKKKRLPPVGFKRAFRQPIGTKPIRDLARGKREIVVLFDDITRPTPVYEIVPFVLEELEEAGISERQIRFVVALGAHGAHTAHDFRKKLGEDVLDRFPVYNHNSFDYCSYLGKTSYGTPVSINKEVMACDLKIGIGGLVPHPLSGFGGGGKIILPGVAHIDSITYNHGTLVQSHPECVGLGKMEGNIPRLDIEEAAKMARLDLKIDAVTNLRGEIIGLFVGDPILEHREGSLFAGEVYATVPARGMEIVVVNAYSKASECAIASFTGAASLREEGGDLLVIANEPGGQALHYLFGRFGNDDSGKIKIPEQFSKKVQRLIIVSPVVDHVGAHFFKTASSMIWVKNWEEALALLTTKWGKKANVAVYPDGTVQYFPSLI
jgi:nickel-dependent lactate racemase